MNKTKDKVKRNGIFLNAMDSLEADAPSCENIRFYISISQKSLNMPLYLMLYKIVFALAFRQTENIFVVEEFY